MSASNFAAAADSARRWFSLALELHFVSTLRKDLSQHFRSYADEPRHSQRITVSALPSAHYHQRITGWRTTRQRITVGQRAQTRWLLWSRYLAESAPVKPLRQIHSGKSSAGRDVR